MDAEKPDKEESFDKILGISPVMQFYLEDDAMDGLSTEIAKKELEEHMKNHFEYLNPYENPETNPRVEFQKTMVCENEETLELDETATGQDDGSCNGSGQWVGRMVTKSVVKVYYHFGGSKSYGDTEFVPWSWKSTEKFKKKLFEAGVSLLTSGAESCTGPAGEVATKVLSKMTMREPFPTAVVVHSANEGETYKLHKWMGYLSPKMQKVPFTMLAIPGSHNSATHTMQRDQTLPYDSPNLSFMTPETLESWGRCVKHDINQQLEMGIRYFDFRLKIPFIFSF